MVTATETTAQLENAEDIEAYKIYDEKGNSFCGTYREVGGIVYEIGQGYGTGEDAKAQAMVEAHFQRECNNKYARAMKVIHGDYKGTWAIYVSLCNRGE